MSRPARIEYPGAFYHVMNRGRGRGDIFLGEEYFANFLSVLSEAVERFGIKLHAYCLMTNHYHLLISTPDGNLQRAMRHIGGVYTQRYNKLQQTDGSLFKGRYKSILIDSDEYLLHVSKYIHLNPIDARVVKKLSDYRWSSYPAFIKKNKVEKWLSVDEVYNQLTVKRNKARRYREYVEEVEVGEDIKAFYSKSRLSPILGDQSFAESVLAEDLSKNIEVPRYSRLVGRPSIDDIVEVVALAYKVNVKSVLEIRKGRGLKNTPRKMAMYLAQYLGDYKLTEIALHFGLRHYGGVASAVNAVKGEINSDRHTMKIFNSIIKRLDP